MTTEDPSRGGQPEQPPQPKFDPTAAHTQKPVLRPVRGFPAQFQNQQVLGLADARQISDKVVFTSPAAQFVLPLMDGSRSLDEIVTAVGRGLSRPILEQLVAQLDDAGLLFGPRFDALLAKMRSDFDSAPNLPPASTAAFADALAQDTVGKESEGAKATDEQKAEIGPKRLREIFDQWIDAALKNAEKPSFDELPKAIVAPHLDYPRGWLNYASVYGRLRVVDRPDRVIILGANHFGMATGVCGCDKGYETPLGLCEADKDFIKTLREKLGAEQSEKLFQNRYDHEREHSIELHIPWLQHCLGQDEAGNFCKVFGVLIHDPTVNNGESYDGKGLALDPFIDALKATIAAMPGKTLVVSSADLSHVGPAFGDQQPLAGDEEAPTEFRNKVFQHDKEMLDLVVNIKPDELIAAMSWQQNPTRWCSIGNLVATLKVTQPTSVGLLNYSAAMDEQGHTMVSNAGLVMF